MDYLTGIALVVVLYLVYMSQPSRSPYRSATLSAWGAFPTRSKLLID
jgi:hypothetical protein